ncbi:MAG: PDZ domain-containing protein, partial [Planctomycetota bacterium]
ELLVEREGGAFPVRLVTQPVPQTFVGISGVSATVEALEGDGMAQELGLRVGDRIVYVNGIPVESVIGIEDAVRASPGETEFRVARAGRELTFQALIPNLKALEEFQLSGSFESGTTLTWVAEGGPAWQAGMRPGDEVVSVGGQEVHSWREIRQEGSRAGDKEREMRWIRNGELLSAVVVPVEDTTHSPGHLGIVMAQNKTVPERYGPLAAVGKGLANTVRTFAEIFLMLRALLTRQVSPRNMGGIIMIAQASYYAAQEGIGKLLYLTAVISAALATDDSPDGRVRPPGAAGRLRDPQRHRPVAATEVRLRAGR